MDGPIQKHKFSTRIYTNIKHDENIKNFGLNGSVRRRRPYFSKCVDAFSCTCNGGGNMFGGRTSLIVNIFQPNFQGVSSIQIYIDFRVMITVITLGCWDHFSQAYRSQTRWDWLKRDFPFALEVDFSDVWDLFLEQYYPYWGPSTVSGAQKCPNPYTTECVHAL